MTHALKFATDVADAIAKRAKNTEIRTETLPPEVRMVIEQMKATLSDHETRVALLERINQALVAEASAKVRGAA